MTETITSRWNAADYGQNAAFVPAMGAPVVDLLAPQSGERILDIGCGDGVLTELLVAAGASVVGVDGSPEMIAAARARGLDARVMDGQALTFGPEFDAGFTNAALHWMRDAAGVARGVFAALKAGGRFVGEMGGSGNCASLWRGMGEELATRGLSLPVAHVHWYPSIAEFGEVYGAAGFTDIDARLIPRPTPLPTGVSGWIKTFFPGLMTDLGLSAADQSAIADAVEQRLEPELRQPDGGWVADYVRLRFSMRKPA
ncbi:MAG: methyltransferase [Sphingomonas bacterium]|nr:methyltransferase [Sphingomonas bacterium]